MPLYGLRRVLFFQVLAIGSNVEGLNRGEVGKASFVAPGEERADISRVGVTGVFVLDFRRKKLNKAPVALRAGFGR